MNAWKTLTLAGALIMVCCPAILAQNPIPNPGFETWSAGDPVNWFTSNDGVPNSIIQTADAHSGTSAVRGNVIEIFPGFNAQPMIMSGPMGEGFLTNTQWGALELYYKLNSVGGDEILVSVSFTSAAQGAVGGGGLVITTPASTYTKATMPIFWAGPELPDSCFLFAFLLGPAAQGNVPHLGSWMQLDDFAFTASQPPVCPITMTGDVNQAGGRTTADIVYLVNHVLKGGPIPVPCRASGDVNCDGNVSNSDIVFLVNSVLKGGPAPCDVCTIIPAQWNCP